MKKFIVASVLFIWAFSMSAQTVVNMGANTSQHSISGCNFLIYDHAGQNGNYGNNRHDSLTIYPTAGQGSVQILLQMSDIEEGDTLFFYNGSSVATQAAPFVIGLLGTNWVNNSNFYYQGNNLIISATIQNPTGAITLVFKSNGSGVGSGFMLKVSCETPCQRVSLELDTLLTTPRPHRVDDDPTDMNYYIDLCPGEVAHLVTQTSFFDNDFSYHQSVDSLVYTWDHGDVAATIAMGLDITDHPYISGRGYNLTVSAIDQRGCRSIMPAIARIRTSWNPILGVANLHPVCQYDDINISLGGTMSNSARIEPIESHQQSSLAVDSLVHIPDGPQCPGSNCYSSPVTFSSFPIGATLTSGTQIMAICATLEHSYLGDIDIRLQCPNGTQIVLKSPSYGGGLYLGVPIDDYGTCPGSPINMGTAWDYCWTENISYATLIQGGAILGATGTTGHYSSNSCDSSKRYQKMDYYNSATSFSGLVGCPLNGTWEFVICDNLSIDDGYVTNWEITLDHSLLSQDWGYTVGCDSIRVNNPGYVNISLGHGILHTTDTGDVVVSLTVVDNFGCNYDTSTVVRVYPVPTPDLGPDISFCNLNNALLSVPSVPNSSYYWNTGANSNAITVLSTGNYWVEVTDHYEDNRLLCKGYDTVHVTVFPSPFVDFEIEGNLHCAPANLHFLDKTSYNAHPAEDITGIQATYEWHVYDLNWVEVAHSYLKNPDIIIDDPGEYHVLLIVTTDKGCTDTLMKYSYLILYTQPTAEFVATQDVSYMAESGGSVHFLNYLDEALMADPDNHWYWDFGDGNIDSSEYSPTHIYETWGDYEVTLFIETGNGCIDQVTHLVVIEDEITFPTNIITPNGDGLNDVFPIAGLNTHRDANDPDKYRENVLTIYNRWGTKVYEAKNYDTYVDPKGEVVVGKQAFSGQNCSDGTYTYTFYYKGRTKTVNLSGILMIVRSQK